MACILRFVHDAPSVLLMKRAVRLGDLWSGHMALPGGREDPSDASLLDTAVRETHEEVGLDLSRCARVVGRLDSVPAMSRSVPVALTITPFVFTLERPEPLSLGPEAELTLWLPLAQAASGELSSTVPYHLPQGTVSAPCWQFEKQTIWGLTYRMLSSLIQLVSA